MAMIDQRSHELHKEEDERSSQSFDLATCGWKDTIVDSGRLLRWQLMMFLLRIKCKIELRFCLLSISGTSFYVRLPLLITARGFRGFFLNILGEAR